MISLRKRLFRSPAHIRPNQTFSPPRETARIARARRDIKNRFQEDRYSEGAARRICFLAMKSRSFVALRMTVGRY